MIQVLDTHACINILSSNYIGNLAYIYRNRPFIVPITYFFDAKNNTIYGYSAEGHKIDAMRENNKVSLSISEIDSVSSWKSVLAHGTFEEFSGSSSKAKLHQFSLGVKHLIMLKENKKLDFISEFSSKIYRGNLPIVFQIKIEEITGKMRNVDI